MPEIPSDARQQVRALPESTSCEQAVTLGSITPRNPLHRFPLSADDSPARRPSALIEATHPAIAQRARHLTQDQPYAYAAVKTIHQWVATQIRTQTGSGAHQPADQTLATGQGTALEKALLMAALCQAVGIPARVAVGVEYRPLGGEGHPGASIHGFAFHVWSEAYVSEWVGFDPTHGEWRMDATHLKLADSDAALPHEDIAAFVAREASRVSGLRLQVLRAQATGSTAIRLDSRQARSAQSMPTLDIAQIDLQRLTQAKIPVFEATPNPHRLIASDSDGQLTQGLTQLAEGNGTEARQSFEMALQKARHPLAAFRVGNTLASLGFYTLAHDALTRAAHDDPRLAPWVAQRLRADFPPLLLDASRETALAQALYRANQADTALTAHEVADTLEAIRAQIPGFDAPLLTLGRLALRHGMADEAQAWGARYRAQRPNDPRGWAAQAEASMAQQRYGEAAARFDAAVKRARQFPEPAWDALIPEWQALAAIARARALLANTPRNADAWVQLGQGLMANGQLHDARAAFENARVYQHTHRRATLWLATMDAAEGRWNRVAKAIAMIAPGTFSRADDRARAFALQGDWLGQQGRFAEAATALARAAAVDSQQPAYVLGLVRMHDRLGHPAQGTRVLSQALARTPAPQSRQTFRLALMNRLLTRSPAQARVLAEQAMAVDPLHPAPYHTLAALALTRPDNAGLQDAQTRLDQALALEPDNADALTLQGRVAERQGRVEAAVASYQQALRVDSAQAVSAQRLAALIARYELPIESPAIYRPFSPGERAWLVSTLALDHRFERQQLAVTETLHALLTHPAELSVRNIAQRQATIPVFQAYQNEIDRYEAALRATKAPARFRALHTLMTRLATLERTKIQWYQMLVPTLHLKEAMVQYQNRFAPVAAEGARWYAAYASELQTLTASLPAAERESLMQETGWDAHEAIVLRMQMLSAALAAKMQQGADLNKANPENPKPSDPAAPPPASAPVVPKPTPTR